MTTLTALCAPSPDEDGYFPPPSCTRPGNCTCAPGCDELDDMCPACLADYELWCDEQATEAEMMAAAERAVPQSDWERGFLEFFLGTPARN